MDPLQFDVTLDSPAGGGIRIPYDVRALFGRARVPVVVTVRAGQEHSYRSTVAVYGGEYFVPLDRANATAAAITAGVPFAVTVTLDDEPRVVPVPADLATAIDRAGVWASWERLSHTHQRENVAAIESAKKPETRQRRVQAVITRLSGG